MELSKYKEYLVPSIEIYNRKTKEKIVNLLKEKELIKTTEEQKVLVYQDELISKINEFGVPAIKVVEEWEYIRDYQYSVLFKTGLIKEEAVKELVKRCNLKEFNHESGIEKIRDIISKPTVFYAKNEIILKFTLGKKSINPETEEALKYKYTINAVFHLDSNLIEIRYNPINGLFIDDYKAFYKRNISAVKAWINSSLGIKIERFSIHRIIDSLKNSSKLRLEGQDMRFSDGGKACLEIGSNKSYALPLLGELKDIINQNEEEFNKAIAIKQMLETWIESKEEEADYQWICLCWPDDKGRKTYDVKVRFQFDYFEEDESLLYHYSGPIGMERMNNVVRTIIECSRGNAK
ncbi:MAG: hypothetical protein ACRC6T_09835 [Sarcina sp.]